MTKLTPEQMRRIILDLLDGIAEGYTYSELTARVLLRANEIGSPLPHITYTDYPPERPSEEGDIWIQPSKGKLHVRGDGVWVPEAVFLSGEKIPGPQGPPGKDGKDGNDGKDSIVPGPRGLPGKDSTVPGPRGPPGQDGKDGKDSIIPGPEGAPGKDSMVPGPRGPPGRDGKDSIIPGPPGRNGRDSTIPGPAGPPGPGLPRGGYPGQVPTKATNQDFDVEWRFPPVVAGGGGGSGGSGDVTGPAGATADDIAVFDGATGKILKDSAKKTSDFAAASHTHQITTDTDTNLDGVITGNGSKVGSVPFAAPTAANRLAVVGSKYGDTVFDLYGLFDEKNPAADGTAAPGTVVKAAHRDHVHPSAFSDAIPPAAGNVSFLPQAGTAATYSRSDHIHIDGTAINSYLPSIFDISTDYESAPAASHFRLDNADHSLATHMGVSLLVGETDMTEFLQNTGNLAAPMGYLLIYKYPNITSQYRLYRIANSYTADTHWIFLITYLAGAGTFSSEDTVRMTFWRRGPDVDNFTVPVMNGVAAVGENSFASKSDHVHPTDTACAAASHNHNFEDLSDVDNTSGCLGAVLYRGFDGENTVWKMLPTTIDDVGKVLITNGNGGNPPTWEVPPTQSHTHGGNEITSDVAGATNADTVDGSHAAAFATAGHNHDAAYLGIAAKAADSDKLDGNDSTAFATSGHNHDAAYLGIAAKAADSDKLDGNDSTAFALTGQKLDDFGTPDDNTDLDASTSRHGLLLKATAPAAGLLNLVGIANGDTAYTNKAIFDTTNPEMDGTAAPGTLVIAARRDHVHPTDTSRAEVGHAHSTLTYNTLSDLDAGLYNGLAIYGASSTHAPTTAAGAVICIEDIDDIPAYQIAVDAAGAYFRIYASSSWSAWTAIGGSSVSALDDLSDVAITSAEQGDILHRNSSGFVNLHHGAAGQVLTSGGHGADLAWSNPRTNGMVITGDASITAATATDTGLEMALEAGATYIIDMLLGMTCDNAGGGGKIAVTGPSDLVVHLAASGNSNATTAFESKIIQAIDTLTNKIFCNATGITSQIRVNGSITVTTAGTMKVLAARVTAGDTVKVKAGSYIRWTKVL